MVMLHGLGDSVDGWRWFPEAMNLPWLNYLLVNAPDDYYGGYSWFDLDNMVPGVQRSRKLLFDLLDDLRARGFPAEQITFGGFSQGSLMAIEAGLHYPHRLAGIVGISGWIFEPEKLVQELSSIARQQRLLLTHGTSDPMIPIDKVRPQIPLLKAAGLHLEWHEFMKAHTVAGEEEISSSAISCAPVTSNGVMEQWSDGMSLSTSILQHSNNPFSVLPHTFTSRLAPGIQICSGRGSPVASIARSTMSRIWANHQPARAMRPSRRAALAPRHWLSGLKPSSS